VGVKQILIKRKKGEPFTCKQCGATYLHDQGYQHASYACPERLKGKV
jgi:hypothetical protein